MRRWARRVEPSEHQHQVAVIDWWGSYAPSKGLDVRLLWAMPNAAKRSYALANHMKSEGLRPGVPDLFLALPTVVFHGMFIEMKSAKGKPTTDQAGYLSVLRKQDYNCVVCQGADEAIVAVKAYLNRAMPYVEFKAQTKCC